MNKFFIHGSDCNGTFKDDNCFASNEKALVFDNFKPEFSSTGRTLACKEMILAEFGRPEKNDCGSCWEVKLKKSTVVAVMDD
jgi:hypothetical protein